MSLLAPIGPFHKKELTFRPESSPAPLPCTEVEMRDDRHSTNSVNTSVRCLNSGSCFLEGGTHNGDDSPGILDFRHQSL